MPGGFSFRGGAVIVGQIDFELYFRRGLFLSPS